MEGPGASAPDRARALPPRSAPGGGRRRFHRGRRRDARERGGGFEEGGQARPRAGRRLELPRAAPVEEGHPEGAKNCYQAVLKRGPDLKTLQSMSMLRRPWPSLRRHRARRSRRTPGRSPWCTPRRRPSWISKTCHCGYQVGTAYMSAFFAEGASTRPSSRRRSRRTITPKKATGHRRGSNPRARGPPGSALQPRHGQAIRRGVRRRVGWFRASRRHRPDPPGEGRSGRHPRRAR